MSVSQVQEHKSSLSSLKLAVGLGNPGSAYAHTYHNIGKMFISYLAKNHPIKHTEKTFLAYTYQGNMPDAKKGRGGALILIEPKTFMNESGIAARDAMKKYRIRTEDMIVIHDDSDIPFGGYKFSFHRGAGGHHGVESIIRAIGTKEFWRLRLGIRKRPGKAGELVLKRITKQDYDKLQLLFYGLSEKLNEKSPPLIS